MNIWQSLKKPILILAPMEDVTDTVFRQIIISCGRPDLFFTEFTNVEGLASEKGNEIVSQRLSFTPEEKPIIAQIWGKNPEHYFAAAQKIVSLGFDGIDINMGCPERSVVKNGCCSALINNQPLAHEIIVATQEGAGNLPVSVKTRIGVNKIVTDEWIPFLLNHNLAALTIHGRTAKEQSEVPAHWDEIGKVVKIRNESKKETLIIGNGDVMTQTEARQKVETWHVDGVMIGRGIFHNPYLFKDDTSWATTSLEKRIILMKKHIELFGTTWQGRKHYPTLKKFFKIYISDFPGASELRAKIMETETPEETRAIYEEFSHSRTE